MTGSLALHIVVEPLAGTMVKVEAHPSMDVAYMHRAPSAVGM